MFLSYAILGILYTSFTCSIVSCGLQWLVFFNMQFSFRVFPISLYSAFLFCTYVSGYSRAPVWILRDFHPAWAAEKMRSTMVTSDRMRSANRCQGRRGCFDENQDARSVSAPSLGFWPTFYCVKHEVGQKTDFFPRISGV